MPITDANIILRYILNDHEILSAKAAEIIENNRVNLPIEVACEVVFVLQKVYQVEREKIQEVLSHLIEEDLVGLEKPELLLKALEVYSETKFDFVDCLLVSYCEIYQESIFTFDKKLENYLKRGS